jgi:hypothetical protein
VWPPGGEVGEDRTDRGGTRVAVMAAQPQEIAPPRG